MTKAGDCGSEGQGGVDQLVSWCRQYRETRPCTHPLDTLLLCSAHSSSPASAAGCPGLQRTGANPRASIFHPLTLFLFVLLGSPGASSAGPVTGLSAPPEGPPCAAVQSGPGGERGLSDPKAISSFPNRRRSATVEGARSNLLRQIRKLVEAVIDGLQELRSPRTGWKGRHPAVGEPLRQRLGKPRSPCTVCTRRP